MDQQSAPIFFPMRIEEAQNGGFVVMDDAGPGIKGRTFAFTDAHDLMKWLGETALADKLGAGDWPENVKPNSFGDFVAEQFSPAWNMSVQAGDHTGTVGLFAQDFPGAADDITDLRQLSQLEINKVRMFLDRMEREERRQDEATRNPMMNP